MFKAKVQVFLIIASLICILYCTYSFHYMSKLVRRNLYHSPFTIPHVNKTNSSSIDLERDSYLTIHPFDINGRDIMVFLHIQKTGGSNFNLHLVKNLQLKRACRQVKGKVFKKATGFMCQRPNSNEFWLYSRSSTGWVCGLHPDFTTWTNCLEKYSRPKPFKKDKIFYITILRHPFDRLLSEFKHVQRGATWKTSKFVCNNEEYKPQACYKGDNWTNVTLPEFLDCPTNLAFNRQTRMLANLTEFGCNRGRYIYGRAMLESAKRNLRSLAYFGLTEYQEDSQYLFEKTFGLKFRNVLSQTPANKTHSNEAASTVTAKEISRIREVTNLDQELYNYAKILFFRRLKYFRGSNEIDK